MKDWTSDHEMLWILKRFHSPGLIIKWEVLKRDLKKDGLWRERIIPDAIVQGILRPVGLPSLFGLNTKFALTTYGMLIWFDIMKAEGKIKVSR